MLENIIRNNTYDLNSIEELSERVIDEYSVKIENKNNYNSTQKSSIITIVAGALILANSLDNVNQIQFKKLESPESINSYINSVITPLNDYSRSIRKMTSNYSGGNSELVKKIVAFRSLNHSWDGYEALPAEVESATNAITIVGKLPSKAIASINDLFPNPNGTISFIWENVNDERVSLEVGNSTFSYYVKFNSQDVLFFDNKEINDKEISELGKFAAAV